ncbi:glutathione S-transferase [Azospirillum melinis]|uniref:Glutathione S-transferase n=2 Tax=Azospirillum TaxID=191 RepID=A0A2B8B437_9PROT|nr:MULTISPECIES: glutathione binding-like protein [Azospirillum]MBP2309037.1 GST-like protein [Azospirillum melinis]NUB02607.1 glutathione S-transferase [Azospirillum melinis]PGH52721.1 glutathione S-transferase [Azospirillum palustre]PWC50618.1 glutathione S-transferase [Azospirillum sp. TSA6c]
MLTLYSFPTPNGRKASILLEELGLPYTVHRVDLAAGENKRPDFLAVSPITKIPALAEELPGGRVRRLFGSGAILLHFAERTGRLLPEDEDERAEAMSWFMLGISDLGPTAIDMQRFAARSPDRIPHAIDLYKGELMRCYAALEERLGAAEHLAGASYSIADIACFPFIAAAAVAGGGLLERFPNLKRWHDTVAARPAVQRGMSVPDLAASG